MSKNTTNSNCIVIIFDDAYFEFARNCLLSFSNYPDHPVIKALYHGENSRVATFIQGLNNVDLVDAELDMDKYSRLNLGHIGSPMIYGRYIIWSSLFDAYDKVLYMDCDTLVLKPFPELFEKDEFFALYDNAGKFLFNELAYQNDEFLSRATEDGIAPDVVNRLMINSGLLLVPKKYRTPANFDLINQLSDRYSPFIEHSDQSIISIWMYLNNLRISCEYEYNFMIDRITRPTLGNVRLDEAKILHFSYWKPNKNIESLFKKNDWFVLLKELIQENSDFISDGE